MPEIWFYHLERQPVESVVPRILVGMANRDMSVTLVARTRQALDQISNQLWTSEDTSFNAHGISGDPNPDWHAIWLTTESDGFASRPYQMFIEGLEPEVLDGLVRASIFFDGNEEPAVANARVQWKRFKAQGCAIKYWKQAADGRWQDQAAA
jgi:DNA polymerase III subunit chi